MLAELRGTGGAAVNALNYSLTRKNRTSAAAGAGGGAASAAAAAAAAGATAAAPARAPADAPSADLFSASADGTVRVWDVAEQVKNI